MNLRDDARIIATQGEGIAEIPSRQRKAFAVRKEVLERQESCRDESLGETDALGIGMDGPSNDKAYMEAVFDGLDPPVHE